MQNRGSRVYTIAVVPEGNHISVDVDTVDGPDISSRPVVAKLAERFAEAAFGQDLRGCLTAEPLVERRPDR